jgi:hypothetical protein
LQPVSKNYKTEGEKQNEKTFEENVHMIKPEKVKERNAKTIKLKSNKKLSLKRETKLNIY